MPRIPRLTIEEAKAEIELEVRRKKEIQEHVSAQEEWEALGGRFLKRFTSSEELQRIAGDIVHGKDQIRRIEKRIKKLQAQIDAAS
jgi:hypothetical protein